MYLFRVFCISSTLLAAGETVSDIKRASTSFISIQILAALPFPYSFFVQVTKLNVQDLDALTSKVYHFEKVAWKLKFTPG